MSSHVAFREEPANTAQASLLKFDYLRKENRYLMGIGKDLEQQNGILEELKRALSAENGLWWRKVSVLKGVDCAESWNSKIISLASMGEELGKSKPSWLHTPSVVDPEEAGYIRSIKMENFRLIREVALLNRHNHILNRKCQTLTEENDLWRRHMSVLVGSKIAWEMAHAISIEAAATRAESVSSTSRAFKPVEPSKPPPPPSPLDYDDFAGCYENVH